MRFVIWLAAVGLAGLLAGCGAARATPVPVYLKAAGSTTWLPLMHELAVAYHELQPLVTIEVSGGDSALGAALIAAGQVDIGMVSDAPAELPAGLRSTVVARDAIALIVHPTNPITSLTLIQARDVFAGRQTRWEAVGGVSGAVQVVSREAGSGTRAAFERGVMGARRVTPNALVMPSSATVVEWVSGHPDAIGYVSMGYLDAAVKPLTVEGLAPTPENAATGAYPLTRELMLLTPSNPSPAVTAFLDYAVSAAGQTVVGRQYGRLR
jgi:phosphate transport system substrate-binding protein